VPASQRVRDRARERATQTAKSTPRPDSLACPPHVPINVSTLGHATRTSTTYLILNMSFASPLSLPAQSPLQQSVHQLSSPAAGPPNSRNPASSTNTTSGGSPSGTGSPSGGSGYQKNYSLASPPSATPTTVSSPTFAAPGTRSITSTAAPRVRAVTSVLPPTTTNPEFSTPSSASSATTSFQQQDWAVPPDGGGGKAGTRRPEDIEMDAMAPTGHRRRRSTVTNIPPASGAAGGAGRGHRSTPSVADNGLLEPKISEEGYAHRNSYHARNGDASSSTRAEDDSTLGGSLSDEDLHDDEEMGLTKQDRKRKRAKRKRNTRLDNRIARDKITDEERKEADQNVFRKIAINLVLIGLWYLFSLSISLVSLCVLCRSRCHCPGIRVPVLSAWAPPANLVEAGMLTCLRFRLV
jgi:hypothetical protein